MKWSLLSYLTPKNYQFTVVVVVILFTQNVVLGQSLNQFLLPSDTLMKSRVWQGVGFTGTTYAAFAIGLNNLWYADFERSGLHTFNDWGEWEHVDKFGHAYNAYFQSRLVYNGSRWAGIEDQHAIWIGMGVATLFQSTIEVLDGFSKEWGFSLPDYAFNIGGVALFGLQQKYWGEQRITLKVSSYPKQYSKHEIFSDSGESMTLDQRASDLFGNSFGSQFLKDYNAQTIWASINIQSFLGSSSKIPSWLNIAIGYGAENMFGGFDNVWENELGEFSISDRDRTRQRQYYLSLDVDLTRIKTRSQFLKTLFSFINIIKIPAPSLEYRQNGKFKWNWLHF